jgi:CubicO group peptidase (beta-lactamase class C family)
VGGEVTRRQFVQRAATGFAAVSLAGRAAAALPGSEEPMAARQASSATEERIRRIEEGLLVTPPLRNGDWERATLADRMAYQQCPGVSIAVIEEGRVAWARGYGVCEAGRSRRVTPRTLFQAGSISKPVAAAAVMRLVEEGRLSLDADVNDYLRSWKVPANGAWQPRVTLRQLLSHSAGLTVHGFPGYPRDEPLPSLVQVLNGGPPANTGRIRVDTIPGLQVRYSGGGTSVAQQVLMDVLGKPFPEIARERVLEPLGMTESTYEQPLPKARWSTAASGHFGRGQGTTGPVGGRWHVYPEMAAAGLWSTPTDLARFAIAIQNARAGRSNGFLSAATAELMLTPQLEEAGLGFFLSGEGKGRRFGHGGVDHGFVANLTAYVEGGSGAVVMTNAYSGDLCGEIVRAVASEYGWPEYVPKQERAPADRDLAAACAGRYELKPETHFIVTREGEELRIEAAGQPSLPLRRKSETRFVALAVNAEVTFTRGEDGRVTSLTFIQNGREMTAKRVG